MHNLGKSLHYKAYYIYQLKEHINTVKILCLKKGKQDHRKLNFYDLPKPFFID